MTFEETMRLMASRYPYMTIDTAIREYDGDHDNTLAISLSQGKDVKAVAHWIANQQSIIDLIDLDKKINAIKMVRQMTSSGLKEAKEAVEYFQAHREEITARANEDLEREAEEAIDSIKRARTHDA